MKNWNDNKWNKYGVQTLTGFKETFCVNTVRMCNAYINMYIRTFVYEYWMNIG